MLNWLSRLIDSNEKELKRLQPQVSKINTLEPEFEPLSDGELRAKTDDFKARLKACSCRRILLGRRESLSLATSQIFFHRDECIWIWAIGSEEKYLYL